MNMATGSLTAKEHSTKLEDVLETEGELHLRITSVERRIFEALNRMRGSIPEAPTTESAPEAVPDGMIEKFRTVQLKSAERLGNIEGYLNDLEALI